MTKKDPTKGNLCFISVENYNFGFGPLHRHFENYCFVSPDKLFNESAKTSMPCGKFVIYSAQLPE